MAGGAKTANWAFWRLWQLTTATVSFIHPLAVNEFFENNHCPKYHALTRLKVNFSELGEILFSPVYVEGRVDEWEIGNRLLSTNILAEKRKSRLEGKTRSPKRRSILRSKIQEIIQSQFNFEVRKLTPASSNAEQIRKAICELEEYFSQVDLKTEDQSPDPYEAMLFHNRNRYGLIADLINWRLGFEVESLIQGDQLSSQEKKCFPLSIVKRHSRLVRALKKPTRRFNDDDIRKLIRKYNQ